VAVTCLLRLLNKTELKFELEESLLQLKCFLQQLLSNAC
jgi:hypothetical protein